MSTALKRNLAALQSWWFKWNFE